MKLPEDEKSANCGTYVLWGIMGIQKLGIQQIYDYWPNFPSFILIQLKTISPQFKFFMKLWGFTKREIKILNNM